MYQRILLSAALGCAALLSFPDTSHAQRFGWGFGGRNFSYGNYGYNNWGTGYGNMGYPYSSGWGWNSPYSYRGMSNYSYPYASGYNYPYSYGYTYTQPYYSGYSGNYTQPYTSGYYSAPTYYGATGYAGDTFASDTRDSGYQSFYRGPDQLNNQAQVRVTVPDPNAQVWIDNTPTQQRGFERWFVSPPLESGKQYMYTIKATWMQDGREVTREKKVDVNAGRTAAADFGAPRRDVTGSERDFSAPGTATQESGTNLVLGKVVSAKNNQVVITDLDGSNRRTFTVGPNADVLVNGSTGTLEGLRPGMTVQLHTQEGAPTIATRITTTQQGDRRDGSDTERDRLNNDRRDLDNTQRDQDRLNNRSDRRDLGTTPSDRTTTPAGTDRSATPRDTTPGSTTPSTTTPGTTTPGTTTPRSTAPGGRSSGGTSGTGSTSGTSGSTTSPGGTGSTSGTGTTGSGTSGTGGTSGSTTPSGGTSR